MGSISADAIFISFITIFVASIGFLIKVAVDFGQIKAGLRAAHKRLDKFNGLKSDDE